MMKLKRYNKATAALVAGAVSALLGGFFVLDPEVLEAIQVLVTAGLVYLVPDGRK